ncbi:flavin reductase like domain-containing protein [Aspergillus egyptiacus]|nr:flavin reductase like domain-containing protein [Aspergillus egyptiacus]
MKLHSRTLLSASRAARQCRQTRYPSLQPICSLPHNQPHQQQCLLHRPLTTSAKQNTPRNELSASLEGQPSISLSDEVRLLMRRVPYPVAIITSTDPTSTSTSTTATTTTASRFRGMTVSSFNTVTLTPTPVISFNVRRPSETLHALLSSGRFLVHLLAPKKETAALARDFARGNQSLALSVKGNEGEFEFAEYRPTHSGPYQSGDLDAAATENNGQGSTLPLPMLRRRGSNSKDKEEEEGSGCFPFIFECRLLPECVVDVYDHTIVVGSVVRAISTPDASSVIANTDAPYGDLCLTYANTRFWEAGKAI